MIDSKGGGLFSKTSRWIVILLCALLAFARPATSEEGESEDRSVGFEQGESEDESAGAEQGESEDESVGFEQGESEDESAGSEQGESEDESAGSEQGESEDESAGSEEGESEDESAAVGDWRILKALQREGLKLEIQHRTRYEFLNDEFRTSGTGDSDVVAMRTLVHGHAHFAIGRHGLTLGAELQDSRAYQNGNAILNTGIVNPIELLRAYVTIQTPDTLGGTLTTRGGLLTIDVGSRRFVARNRYRNTINGFAGIDTEWRGDSDIEALHLRGFWMLPRYIQPQSRKRLLDNDIVFDTESVAVQFWGLFGAGNLGRIGRLEVFFFGLNESDSNKRPTQNRKLYTPGFRLFRGPAKSRFDYVIESAVQAGKSRASTSSTNTLDHLAHFHHLTLGYSFDAPFSPRIALLYDYASGDGNPSDNDNGRFDTLYGARRFDFGPTGIYGAFARGNLQSVGVRFQANPHERVTSFFAVRSFLLASDQDAWTTSGVQDPSGRAGHYVGTQFEISARWHIVPKNVMLEAGYAHLFAGDFIDDAPNSNREGDSDYFYSSIRLQF